MSHAGRQRKGVTVLLLELLLSHMEVGVDPIQHASGQAVLVREEAQLQLV